MLHILRGQRGKRCGWLTFVASGDEARRRHSVDVLGQVVRDAVDDERRHAADVALARPHLGRQVVDEVERNAADVDQLVVDVGQRGVVQAAVEWLAVHADHEAARSGAGDVQLVPAAVGERRAACRHPHVPASARQRHLLIEHISTVPCVETIRIRIECIGAGHRTEMQLFRSGLFCVCTFYLELSTCSHSFCRHPIHL